MNEAIVEKLNVMEKRYEEVLGKMSQPEVAADPNRLRELSKEQSELKQTVETYRQFLEIENQIADSTELTNSDDEDMIELAKVELSDLKEKREAIVANLKRLLIPKDPHDGKNVLLEIRAGTGGEEASLFAGDLFRMYSRTAERKGWQVEILSSNETGLGGYKEVIMLIKGSDAYMKLRFESGTHRVQRIPQTETQGRIHTSAATVAVLPEADEVDIDIKDDDLRIDVFRSSGPGGQSVNTTDSAVRITHIPTGTVVTCQDEKSQIKNKAKAMKVLRARILDVESAKQQAERSETRKSQIGTGDRSGRIRTYNFPQSRITDHRIHYTSHRMQEFLDGDIDDLVSELNAAAQSEAAEGSEA